MMNKKYLFLSLLLTLTTQISFNLFSMPPQEINSIKNNPSETETTYFDAVNKKLSEILAEASIDKRNGLKIMSLVRELKDYLQPLRLNDSVIELIHFTTETLNSIKTSFLEKQKDRATIIKFFDSTIKILNAKLNNNGNNNNTHNNNNNGTSPNVKTSEKRKLTQFYNETRTSTKNSFILKEISLPQAKKLRLEAHEYQNQNIKIPSNNSITQANAENSKKRKLTRFLSETDSTAENYNLANEVETSHLPHLKKSCFESNFDINVQQSPLSKKLWGFLPRHKRNEICGKIDRYRACLELKDMNTEGRRSIAIDEKMPITPLIACLKLRDLENACMLIDAGVDCNMQGKTGETPVAVALEAFMDWSTELDQVFFKIIDKIEMNHSVAEKLIKIILSKWKHYGEFYLSHKCPHSSRSIFFYILEAMQKNNIRLRDTDLINKAIETKEQGLVELILKYFDNDVDFNDITIPTTNGNKKLLFYLMREALIYMMKPLIKSKKFSLSIEDEAERLPIVYLLENLPGLAQLTFKKTLREAIDMLIDETIVNKKNRLGNTLFHTMVFQIDHLSNCFENWDEFFYKLINLGANPNIQNQNGETPLHAFNFNVKVIEKLEDKNFRSRFMKIFKILCEKTDDRLTDIFGKSAQNVKYSLWAKNVFQGNDYQEFEKQNNQKLEEQSHQEPENDDNQGSSEDENQTPDRSHNEILDN